MDWQSAILKECNKYALERKIFIAFYKDKIKEYSTPSGWLIVRKDFEHLVNSYCYYGRFRSVHISCSLSVVDMFRLAWRMTPPEPGKHTACKEIADCFNSFERLLR